MYFHRALEIGCFILLLGFMLDGKKTKSRSECYTQAKEACDNYGRPSMKKKCFKSSIKTCLMDDVSSSRSSSGTYRNSKPSCEIRMKRKEDVVCHGGTCTPVIYYVPYVVCG